ncbi:D-glycero-beta-D-manno-heptose-1,7-bisphosphate 7-phosphatase [Carnimonas sp. R-84981]|uniref:D-glycero-beta-D-manno-heptose 1,7-bisphosphate 7-phosphatase n=1 Tax=Carnimonas bestiolae TaxID=3402172 RepID=UPI003EDC8B75
MSNPLVILDRDGVINQDSSAYVKTLAEWVPIPGSIEAIARLSKEGYQVAVATNQAGIGRGIVAADEVGKMHRRLTQLVSDAGGQLVAIEFCPHHPDERCACRKPQPGMLFAIRDALGVEDLTNAWMVGDSLRDLQAGEAAGTRTALVLTGNGEKTREQLSRLKHPEQVAIFSSLADFADTALSND